MKYWAFSSRPKSKPEPVWFSASSKSTVSSVLPTTENPATIKPTHTYIAAFLVLTALSFLSAPSASGAEPRITVAGPGRMPGLFASQDTTRRSQAKKKPQAQTEVEPKLPGEMVHPSNPAAPEDPILQSIKRSGSTELTLEELDSLASRYPEYKEYFLRTTMIESALREDWKQIEIRKLLQTALAGYHPPSAQEVPLLRNQLWYGTKSDATRPAGVQNQINLFDVMVAIENLLHTLGLR